jgi:uncharacterized protein YjbI with pentapeptide repeats
VSNNSPPTWPAEHQVIVKSFAPSGTGTNLGASMSVWSTQWNTTNCTALTPVIVGKDSGGVAQGIEEFHIGKHTALNVHLARTTTPPMPTLWDFLIGGAIDSTEYPGYPGNWHPRTPDAYWSFSWLARTPANARFEVLDTVDYLKTYGRCPACDFTNYVVEGFAVPVSCCLYHANATGAVFKNMSFGSGMDFTGIDLTNATFENVTFDAPSFQGVSLKGTTFSGSTSLSSPNFTGATLNGVVFAGSAKLLNPVFQTATLSNTTIRDSAALVSPDLRGATFDGFVGAGGTVSNAQVGKDAAGNCSQFKNSVLTRMNLGVGQIDSACLGTPLFPGSTLQPKSVSVLNWTGVNWGNAILVSEGQDSAYLKGANLSGAILSGAAFWGAPVDLTGTNLSGARLDHTAVPAANFTSANLTNVSATAASFAGSTFTNARLSGSGANFSDAVFVNTDLTGASFASANISNADFSGARAENTDFGSTIAVGVVFVGAHILNNPNAFQNAILTSADFTLALLGGMPSVEGGVNFNSAHLSSARFDAVQCIGCNFSQAQLDQASFNGAYLPGVVFTGANLKQAHFLNAFTTTTSGVWQFALGLGEPPFSVLYTATNWAGADTTGVTVCPNAQGPSPTGGCLGRMAQENPNQTPIPPPCSPSGESSCVAPFVTLAGDGTAGYSNTQVKNASDVVSAAENIAYFADTGNFIVRKITVGQPPPATFAGTPGTSCAQPTGACGDGGLATAAAFVEPFGLALGWDGTVYVADRGGNKVRAVTPDGKIATVAGTGTACASSTSACGDGGAALEAALNAPSGVWVDPVGNIYVADSGNNRIRVVTTAGTIQTVAGTGAVCQSATSGCGDGGHASQAQLTFPTRVAGDDFGNLYVADTGNHKIRKLAPDNTITTVFGTGVAGYNGTVDPFTFLPISGTDAQLSGPTGLAVNHTGGLFVADTGNGLIRTLSTQGGVGLTAGLTNADDSGTIQGWNGDGLWADQTEISGPVGVAVTPRNQYVITDTANQRVRTFGPYPVSVSVAHPNFMRKAP